MRYLIMVLSCLGLAQIWISFWWLWFRSGSVEIELTKKKKQKKDEVGLVEFWAAVVSALGCSAPKRMPKTRNKEKSGISGSPNTSSDPLPRRPFHEDFNVLQTKLNRYWTHTYHALALHAFAHHFHAPGLGRCLHALFLNCRILGFANINPKDQLKRNFLGSFQIQLFFILIYIYISYLVRIDQIYLLDLWVFPQNKFGSLWLCQSVYQKILMLMAFKIIVYHLFFFPQFSNNSSNQFLTNDRYHMPLQTYILPYNYFVN